MGWNFDLFFVRFLIYIKFSSNLAQPQNSWSIRLKMAQGNVKILLLKIMKKVALILFATYLQNLMGSSAIFVELVWSRSWRQKVQGMTWELTKSQSDQKPLEPDEKLTAKRARHIDHEVEKNCKEGLDTSHARLPGKALRINPEANGSCHSGSRRTYQILIHSYWLFCIVLVNKWTYTLGVAILIS